jgi:hypothetical protein
MKTPAMTPKDRKLKNLRTILLIVFSAIAITILIVGILSIPIVSIINRTTDLIAITGVNPTMFFLSVAVTVVGKSAVTGLICLVIYYIFKYRLDKDEDLFP